MHLNCKAKLNSFVTLLNLSKCHVENKPTAVLFEGKKMNSISVKSAQRAPFQLLKGALNEID